MEKCDNLADSQIPKAIQETLSEIERRESGTGPRDFPSQPDVSGNRRPLLSPEQIDPALIRGETKNHFRRKGGCRTRA